MPPLSIMIKPVSSSCNMRCGYCFYRDVSEHRETENFGIMSASTVNSLVRRAFIEADISISFAFQGGEPTLAGEAFFENFVKTVNSYNTRGLEINYSVQTNGYALTEGLCKVFAKYGFLCGVSLDGTEGIHDLCRKDIYGNGTYKRIEKGIALLEKHKVEYNILCVVTKQLASEPENVWNALAKYKYLQFIPCIDDFGSEQSDFSLTPEEYGEFLITTFKKYKARIPGNSPVSERRFDNYVSMLLGEMPEYCGMCGMCGEYYLIEANGGVYPCDFYVTDEWLMGNVNDTSFARIRKSDAARRFAELGKKLPSECAECKWRELCRGGCRRDREPYANGIPSQNRLCQSYRMFFEECIDGLKEIAYLVENSQY